MVSSGSCGRARRGAICRLTNHWVFEKVPGGCRIDFYVDFEFKSRLMQRMIEVLFSEAVRRMVGAFEKRAHDLYDVPLQKTAGQAAE
jgi:coenzyme Q-binding protein COQ10